MRNGRGEEEGEEEDGYETKKNPKKIKEDK